MKLYPIPRLEAGETISESWLANRSQTFRAVGGCLYLTNHRVVFEPHVIDANLGGKKCALPLEKIARVTLEPGKFRFAHFFSGGLVTRLRVETKAGRAEHFVVQHPEKIQSVIAKAVSSAPRGIQLHM